MSRESFLVLFVVLLVISALFYAGMSEACEAKGGHLDWSIFRRDLLCLTDDGRVITIP